MRRGITGVFEQLGPGRSCSYSQAIPSCGQLFALQGTPYPEQRPVQKRQAEMMNLLSATKGE